MRLTAKAVGDALETILGWRVEMTPHGFDLRNDLLQPERARLRSGSGIGGQSDVWALVRLPEGTAIATKINTRAKLSRAILEFMAGPPPPRLSDYTVPRAKRVFHPRTGTPRFVWYRRLKKRPPTRVTCVPFGAAQR